MNRITPEELFGHVRQFLQAKGIELQEGAYSRTLHKGCQFLTDTINLSQQAVERAKVELEKKLDRAREVIHQKTAPKTPPAPAGPSEAAGKGTAQSGSSKSKSAKARRSRKSVPGKAGKSAARK